MTINLEKELFQNVQAKTPDYIKNRDLINLSNSEEFVFTLKKEHLLPYDPKTNPEGLGLKEWFEGYAKEAKVSTAGIRGPQNILYPLDTRFPINLVGIVLATLAKALVLQEGRRARGQEGRLLCPPLEGGPEFLQTSIQAKIPRGGHNYTSIKIAGREVRYNSELYLDAIARIQAANGIRTLVATGHKTMPIWMASFLAFKLDLAGGEYITSSHGISVKNATKDLNSQGSQYLPEESMAFVDKIRQIFAETEKNGSYAIKFSAKNDPLIDEKTMQAINDGVDLYVEYLKNGVAQGFNLDLIKNSGGKIVIENVGGSAYHTLSRVLKKLGVEDKFIWFNKDEDPFFHGIGKYDRTPKGEKAFYDYSVDATVVANHADGKKFFPVIETLGYDEKLKNYPHGTVVLITDPDHDRLTIAQTEGIERLPALKKAGIDYIKLNDNTILTVFSANQAFLMLMDFWAKQLKKQGLWENHPRFMIKTTASALSWDEWAAKNGVHVVNVPVGFKEIANILRKVEKQEGRKARGQEGKQFPSLENSGDSPSLPSCLPALLPSDDAVIMDVFGDTINLGKEPRLLFGGEESGGMIMGPEELIQSQTGRRAVAMREKSATEAIVVASALTAELEKTKTPLSLYLEQIFDENSIIGCFDTRVDISYYNESEPDIEKLKREKILGEEKRTKNDLFYLSLAMAVKQGLMSITDARAVLNDAFKDLNFNNLKSVKFVGDGTYLEFDDKYIEIRPSGTDAKTKAYGGGSDKEEIETYAAALGNYPGDRTAMHIKFISDKFYNETKDLAMEYYLKFVDS